MAQTPGSSSGWGWGNIILGPLPAGLLIACPDCKMVQDNRCCYSDVEGGRALSMLWNIYEAIAKLELVLGKPSALHASFNNSSTAWQPLAGNARRAYSVHVLEEHEVS